MSGRPADIFQGTPKNTYASHPGWRTVLTFWIDRFDITIPPIETPYLTMDADVLATKHDAKIVADELHGTLKIATMDDNTSNTAIVTYQTPDGRSLFVDFMGSLIGLTNKDIRETAVELEHPKYGLIRVLHPTLVLKSRIVNLHRLSSKRDTNGIEQARLAVLVAKEFFENYVASGFAGKNPDRYLIDRAVWLGKLALSDAGMFVFTQWGIDVMGAAPTELISKKNSMPNIGRALMPEFVLNVIEKWGAAKAVIDQRLCFGLCGNSGMGCTTSALCHFQTVMHKTWSYKSSHSFSHRCAAA